MSANNSDETLWKRANDGDGTSFGVIFDRHAKRIYNHCFHRTANWTLAEDLTSIVFLEAWKSRSNAYFVETSALPWLLGFATSVCCSGTRSLMRYGAALARLPEKKVELAALESDVLIDRLDAEKQMREILEELSKLPEEDRVLIELAVWDGLSHQGIAIALDIPVGMVGPRLSRARARMRSKTHSIAAKGGRDRDSLSII